MSSCVSCLREEELQMQKRKKRRVKGDPRLSFCDDIENGSDEDDFENRTLLLTHPWSYYSIVSLPHLWTFVYHTFSLFLVPSVVYCIEQGFFFVSLFPYLCVVIIAYHFIFRLLA